MDFDYFSKILETQLRLFLLDCAYFRNSFSICFNRFPFILILKWKSFFFKSCEYFRNSFVAFFLYGFSKLNLGFFAHIDFLTLDSSFNNLHVTIRTFESFYFISTFPIYRTKSAILYESKFSSAKLKRAKKRQILRISSLIN